MLYVSMNFSASTEGPTNFTPHPFGSFNAVVRSGKKAFVTYLPLMSIRPYVFTLFEGFIIRNDIICFCEGPTNS